jgi:zinc protease
VRTVEPEQKGERRVAVNRMAQLPLEMLCYHVPRTDSPDHYALEVLSNILSEGRSSRLYRRLVDRDQLAINVRTGTDLSLAPGLFMVTMQPRSGVDPSKTEQAFMEEVERLRSGGITPDELQKAKNQLLVTFYREMNTIAGRANLLGQYELFFGDYNRLLSAGSEIEKVTATDVQNAAKRYLDPKNKTIATLIPEKREAAK